MNSPDAARGLAAFSSVDFNSAIRLADIWSPPCGDVPELHAQTRKEVLDEIDRLNRQAGDASPLGRFIVGDGGSGKTHLLCAIRHDLARKGLGFILIDMTDVANFWETVAQGYLNSLDAIYVDGKPQHQLLLGKLVERIPATYDVARTLEKLASYPPAGLCKNINIVLGHLRKGNDPSAVQRHQDAIRALICVSSKNPNISSAGLAWLQGIEMEASLAGLLQFHKPRAEPREVVRALSWVMSLAGPCVLAFDQLDPIVHQVARQNVNGDSTEQRTARGIIDQIGNGLAALRETTLKTLVVVSCLEASYRVLAREVLSSNLDRFHPPTHLQNPGLTHYQTLIEARLAPHFQEANYAPRYPSWPFTSDAVQGLKGQSPRRVLQLCEQYRQHCASVGRVEELASFADIFRNSGNRKASRDLDHLDREFQKLRGEADLNALRNETTEDTALAPLYQNALRCLINENHDILPEHIQASVEQAFGGSKKIIPLHARLRLIFQDEGDREEHFSVRVLLKTHAAAYKSRLKLAMTESGIDVNIPFRRLTIVRCDAIPGGAETERDTKRFLDQGGRFHHPEDDELRTLFALSRLAERNDPDWPGWLLETKPVSTLKLGHVLAPGSVFVSSTERAVP